MNTSSTQHISAIIEKEKELELAISDLIGQSVARSDISVQGTPEQIKKQYGLHFLAPEVIQNKTHPPIKEPFLRDDMGWLIGFSFAIPFFICLIIGVFIIPDIRATSDVRFYGILGAIVGGCLGFFISRRVKRTYENRLREQEKSGGFVVWVTTHNEEQHTQALDILEKYHSKSLRS